MTDSIRQARDWLVHARRVAVLTGAGVSAESGVPTFRGAGGLWRGFRAEELATPEAFQQDPVNVWTWYDWRRGLIAGCEPNPAHHALVRLEAESPEFLLITQNVDGLHERAGNRRITRLHGSIWELRCTGCGTAVDNREVPLSALPPRCGCGALQRPGVVWFGESLPAEAWNMAEDAVLACDLLLVVGTSAVVYPAASLIGMAREAGARVVEVNREPSAQSRSAHIVIPGNAGEVLPWLGRGGQSVPGGVTG